MRVRKTAHKLKKVEVVLEDYTVCDKCNQRIKPENNDAFDFNFSLKTGYSYPIGGGGEIQELDVCPTCANELVELLKANGFKVSSTDWDYP